MLKEPHTMENILIGATTSNPDVPLPDLRPTTDAEQLLRALAAMGRIKAPTMRETIGLKLQCLMNLLDVPSAFVSSLTSTSMDIIASEDRDGCGIPDDGVVPIEGTFCQYVKVTGKPVVIPDAANDPRVADVSTRHDFRIAAYAGVPLRLNDGTLHGSLCALDTKARPFSETQILVMEILALEISAALERELLLRKVTRAANDAMTDVSTTLNMIDKQRSVLNIVAHDLRTPLTAIYIGSDMLLDNPADTLSPKQRVVVEAISRSSHYMNRLVNDLLDVSSAEDPQLLLVTGAYDGCQLGHDLVALCQHRAHSAGLALNLELAAASLPLVGDQQRVMQVLLNLLNNAIAYTTKGSVTLHVAPDDSGGILFTVADTGPGIPAEMQERIWQPYVRGSKQGKGFGLGLHIVKLLAQHMGGTVGLESTVGVGSTFWLRLPDKGPRPQRIQWELPGVV